MAFIAALIYSDYFYAEGMTECDIKNWIRVNNNALAYFGGVTPTVTPDNCEVAVARNKDWISPVLNKDFQAWAEHNGTVLTPAKVRSPRWKPVVEGDVKIGTMHILVDMEEMFFYLLDDFNRVLAKGLEPCYCKIDNFRNVQERIRNLYREHKTTLVVLVDEAQYLGRAIFADLKLLMNFEMDSRNYAVLVLAGVGDSFWNREQMDRRMGRVDAITISEAVKLFQSTWRMWVNLCPLFSTEPQRWKSTDRVDRNLRMVIVYCETAACAAIIIYKQTVTRKC